MDKHNFVMDKIGYDISYDLDGHAILDVADEHYKIQLMFNKNELLYFKKQIDAILEFVIKHEEFLQSEESVKKNNELFVKGNDGQGN